MRRKTPNSKPAVVRLIIDVVLHLLAVERSGKYRVISLGIVAIPVVNINHIDWILFEVCPPKKQNLNNTLLSRFSVSMA